MKFVETFTGPPQQFLFIFRKPLMYSLSVVYTRCYLHLKWSQQNPNVVYTYYEPKKRGTPKVKIKTETRTEIKYERSWMACVYVNIKILSF